MEPVKNLEQFVVFDEQAFTRENQQEGGRPAEAVLGLVRAENEVKARDTAETLYQEKRIFVRAKSEAGPEFVNAAEKRGYLNTSQPHTFDKSPRD